MKSEAKGHYTAESSERVVHASHRQLEYRIRIAVPKEPPPEKGYPIIYATDGDAVFGTFAEAALLQTRKPHGYDPVIIVGIGYPSGEPFDMTRRCYDFTTPAKLENLPARPNGQPWPEHGGADGFLDFLETELKPVLEKEFPIDKERQTIFGHSLGGLLVLHALFSRPQSFQRFAAGSPSIWWNKHAVLEEQAAFEARLPQIDHPPKLLITIGAEELPDMVKDSEQLADSLRPLQASGFHAAIAKFPEESHVSVLPGAISRVIKFALSG
ncbi:alpha/beta hydrolase [Paenibacillus sp. Leaf72]|uniref:alpha/beta hydrolase n=1 Tax=Paenibacillus sp. Leaf72 TaxID=1736234 RepID=UPI0006FBBC32|nr:alpha/beta hydrolase-fold protein [Paenibacillus sp. Leaf72]KQO18371.1 alpha/beta hydrolase [Paenibacillus sp. Leaf72]